MQLWTKAQPNQAAAVLVINVASTWGNVGMDLDAFTFQLSELPGLASTVKAVTVRDVWNKTDLGDATGSFTTDAIKSGDNRLYLLTPK